MLSVSKLQQQQAGPDLLLVYDTRPLSQVLSQTTLVSLLCV